MKAGYFKQTFCQSYLTDGETYVLLPPKDFPITPQNTYLHLIRILYGFKRIPHHWYQNLRATFLVIGLKKKNPQCIFSGSIIPGHPPIYVGLYVDDFIYFSASELVKTEFVRRIKNYQKVLVDFEVNPKCF